MRELVEHTGELELRLRARSLPELFAEAGRALADLMIGDNTVGFETVHDSVTVAARDTAALLVAWIDELVYRAETQAAVFTRFELDLVGNTELRATIHGFSPAVFQSPVKAATYHRLALDREGDGYAATVILDV